MNLTPLEEKLRDPMWRLTSGELYKIAPADGSGIVPFRPRPEQVRVFEAVHKEGRKRILIPKARRLGMSTAIGILAVDKALFGRQQQISLIDQNAADAERKLDRIMKVALENLPDWLALHVKTEKSNGSQLTFGLQGKDCSSIYAGMNARGGSNDLLHISEWGVIQYEDPKRSSKIRSGALPSARHGVTIVETTWAGGKGGDVWELLEPTLTGKADDWTVLFFPWYLDPRNVAPESRMDAEAEAYFAKIAPRLERDGITLSEELRRSWQAADGRGRGRAAQVVGSRAAVTGYLHASGESHVPG